MSLIEVTEVMGNIGEFIGSFAVLATLVYLAVQVRHGRSLLETSQRIAMNDVVYKKAVLRTENAKLAIEIAEINKEEILLQDYATALELFNDLSKADQIKLRAVALSYCVNFEFVIASRGLGFYDQDMASMDKALKGMVPACEAIGVTLPAAVLDYLEQQT